MELPDAGILLGVAEKQENGIMKPIGFGSVYRRIRTRETFLAVFRAFRPHCDAFMVVMSRKKSSKV